MTQYYGQRYRAYTNPLRPMGRMGLRTSKSHWTVLSNVVADWTGNVMYLDQLDSTGALTTQTYVFHDDDPPIPPSIGINLHGFTTIEEIAGAIAVVLSENGWVVSDEPPDFSDWWVFQPFPGAAGNTPISANSAFNGILQLNDVTAFNLEEALFYDGQGLEYVARFGKNFALLAGASSTPTNQEQVE